MTTISYPVRLFGGRGVGVVYDAGAGTISIQGQSLALSTLPDNLQSLWSDVVGLQSTSMQTSGRAAFGGNQVQQVVGEILDQTPTWRTSVEQAINALFPISRRTAPPESPRTASGECSFSQSAARVLFVEGLYS